LTPGAVGSRLLDGCREAPFLIRSALRRPVPAGQSHRRRPAGGSRRAVHSRQPMARGSLRTHGPWPFRAAGEIVRLHVAALARQLPVPAAAAPGHHPELSYDGIQLFWE